MEVVDNEKVLDQFYKVESSHQGETSEHSSQMNAQTNANLTRKKRIIFWVYLATIFAYIVAVSVATGLSYQPTKSFLDTDHYYYANQVTKEWKTGFITDLKVINGSSCPTGYETAVNYEWSGSSFGCYCNINANLTFVLVGYCAAGLIQAGCSNVANVQAEVAHNWANSSRLCIQRSGVSFANEQKYDNSTNQLCGGSQSLVVVPSGSTCPLVNISFTAFTLEDHFAIAEDNDSLLNPLYYSFNSTSPFSFYSYPVAKLGVSQYEFCLMDEDTGIDPTHSDYVLLNTARGCADGGNYSTLASITEIEFYAANDNLQGLTANTGFPDPGNWQYNLGFASIAGWTYKCRHTYNGKFSISNAIDQFNFTYETTYSNLLIGVTVCLVVVLLEVVVLTLRRIINSAVYPVGYKQKNMPKHFCMALSRYLLDFVAKLAVLALTMVNILTIYINYNWFRSAINLNCADSVHTTIQEILRPYMDLYQSLFNYSLATLVLTVAMLIIDVIHFCYIWSAELTHYLIETQGQLLIKKETTEFDESKENEEIKWVNEQKNSEVEPIRSDADEFRMTMAQNIFSYEENESPQKLKKKKKKRATPLRGKAKPEKAEKNDYNSLDNVMSNDLNFNPYEMGESIGQLDSVESSQPKPKNPSPRRRRR